MPDHTTDEARRERQRRSREARKAAGKVGFHRVVPENRVALLKRVCDLPERHVAFLRRLLDGLR